MGLPRLRGAAKYQHPWYEQDRHVIIEWDHEEKKLIRRACMQCAVKQHALPCHDITAITDPAHAHEICTKTLKVVEKSPIPPQGV